MTQPPNGNTTSPTQALKHLVNSRFDTFLQVEADPNITSAQKVAVSLFRSIFSHNPRNIRTAINRLDGLLPRQVDIVLPKVYYLYPNAKLPSTQATKMIEGEAPKPQDVVVKEVEQPQPSRNIPELTLREATQELSALPFSLVESIIKDAEKTAHWFNKSGPQPRHIPYLKSVVAAHLVQMAAKAIPDVVEDFFDSVDGRLAETIKVGEDIYLTSYQTEAPPEAVLNDDGILMVEATAVADMWGKALQKGKKLLNE